MCARFSLTSPIEAIRRLFQFNERFNLAPSYNIPPTSKILAIRLGENTSEPLECFQAHWGLIPSWAKDPSISQKLINARSETAHEKPSFREAFKKRRCLIPANGFFEWQKGPGSEKQPYFIKAKDADLFTFAGLWENWTDETGKAVESCTILTQPASENIKSIHARMPVTVRNEFAKDWLEGSHTDSLPDEAHSEEFYAYPVNKKVGNVRNNTADLIDEITLSQEPEQGSLF